MVALPPAAEIPALERIAEVPVRELRNRTRDVMQLVEQGWTVYLTSHGRRFAELRPTADPVAAPRLAALLDELDSAPPEASGLDEVIAAARDRDRADPAADPMAAPWR
jgi:antitoxin (DNA-binding transcriptional repressor) of toxin-antitoxin stability system